MDNPNRQQQPHIKRTQQYVLNDSFDEEFKVLAVENLVYNPSTGTLDRDTGDQTLAVRIDDTSTANTVYICKAPIGSATSAAVWQIAKLDTSSGLVKTWADGNASFDNVADNRTSLSYS